MDSGADCGVGVFLDRVVNRVVINYKTPVIINYNTKR